MMDMLTPLLQSLNEHPNLAALAIFIISVAESVAIIGTILPGTIMMTAIGTLMGAGVIPIWLTMSCAILGAIVGDGISYLIGYHFKDHIRDMWPFRNNPAWFERGEKFFAKHGGKSVFIGRFVGPVRAIVPLIAGMLGMKPFQFYLANILSAIGWAPVYLFPGMLLGAVSLELSPEMAVHAMLMLLLVTLFIIFCIWSIIKILILISYQIDQTLNRFWQYLLRSRYTHGVPVLLKHYNVKKTHGQLLLAFYLIVASTLFTFLAYGVAKDGPVSFFINDSFFHFFRGLRSPINDRIMVGCTILGERNFILMLTCVFWSTLLITRRFYLAWHVFFLSFLTFGSIEIFKIIVHSPRPWGIQHSPLGFSYPSGHTTLSAVFFVGLALIFSKIYPTKRRSLLIVALAISFLVGISRLYLGAHWFTDVIGGWLLAASLLMIITISYNRQKSSIYSLGKVIVILLVSSVITYGLAYLHYFQPLMQNSRIKDYPIHTMNIDAWWQQTDTHLPLYRVSRFGTVYQMLNLQWVGNLDAIIQLLLKNNWIIPPERDWISVLQRISDVQSAEQLPLVSPLYLDKKPVLVLIKRTENKKRILVLHLWDSNVLLQPHQQHLWVGTLSYIPRTYSWLFRKKSNELAIDPSLLFLRMPEHYTVKVFSVPPAKIHHKHKSPPVIVLLKPTK